MLYVKIKKLNEKAVIPKYATYGDAGLDLTAISEKIFFVNDVPTVEYGTGLSVEIPEGYVGFIFPRSSIGSRTTLSLANSVGVIDSGYRGEIKFQFRDLDTARGKLYKLGERIGQLVIMPYPKIELVESLDLANSERSVGGFGSSGS